MSNYQWWLEVVPGTASKYSPDQPRVPAGDPEGGQWTGSGGSPGQPRVLPVGEYKMLVVKPGQRIDSRKIGEVNPVALSPDGNLLVAFSDDPNALIDTSHASLIQAYQKNQKDYDRYVRGYLGQYDGKLSFYAESVQMGIGGGIYGLDDDWSALGAVELEDRANRSYRRMARALLLAGLPGDTSMQMQMQGQPSGAGPDMPISEAVDWKSHDYQWQLEIKGGPGSGHYGHAGRPGKVGGSAPGEGGEEPSSGGEAAGGPIGGGLDGLPDWTGKHKLASDISGTVPTDREGKPVKVRTITRYHVGTKDKIKSLLTDGFDISKVRTNWQNDLAMSLNSTAGLDKAMGYFTPSKPGAKFDTDKYWVVAVTVKGRFFSHDYRAGYGDNPVPWPTKRPQEYTKGVVEAGYDASDQIYVYNPEAITRIHLVEADKVNAANEKLAQRKRR